MDTVYAPKTGLYIPGTSGNYISTPDHPDLDITGDLCLIVVISAADWSPPLTSGLIGKYGSGGQRSFVFVRNPSGALTLFWTSDGSTNQSLASTQALVLDSYTKAWLATSLDVDNGNSNSEVKFWYSLDGINWIQLGNTRLFGATTSIFSGTSILELGTYVNGTTGLNECIMHSAQVYSGIGDNSAPGLGTLVAEFDASKCKPRYRDRTGKIWSINGSDVVTEKVYHE